MKPGRDAPVKHGLYGHQMDDVWSDPTEDAEDSSKGPDLTKWITAASRHGNRMMAEPMGSYRIDARAWRRGNVHFGALGQGPKRYRQSMREKEFSIVDDEQ